jgi:serine/threonine protein kinase
MVPSDRPDHPSGLEPGQILGGKYRIDRILGNGAMGIVLAAHHLQLDERVAIKLLLPGVLQDPDAVARFAREARAAVKIKSEHVARVSDVGSLPDGSPYLVMEYLEGEDLSQALARRGALPIEQSVEFVLHACEALAEAHSLGIVHRDLKPANLFCVRRADGLLSVKVLDFGISKSTAASASGADMGMTKTSAIMGSPLYMSPEQMHSARMVDARSDIWALGTILYELVAARTPFMGESFPELVLKVTGAAPEPITRFRPDVPPGLERVILRCLEKDRAKRFQNVGELAVALAEFGPKRARSSVERITRVVSASGMSASDMELPSSSDPPRSTVDAGTVATFGRTGKATTTRTRSALLIAGAVVVAAAAVGVRIATRGAGTDPPDGRAAEESRLTRPEAVTAVAAPPAPSAAPPAPSVMPEVPPAPKSAASAALPPAVAPSVEVAPRAPSAGRPRRPTRASGATPPSTNPPAQKSEKTVVAAPAPAGNSDGATMGGRL